MIRMINNRSYDAMTGRYGLIFNRRTRWISEKLWKTCEQDIIFERSACKGFP